MNSNSVLHVGPVDLHNLLAVSREEGQILYGDYVGTKVPLFPTRVNLPTKIHPPPALVLRFWSAQRGGSQQ